MKFIFFSTFAIFILLVAACQSSDSASEHRHQSVLGIENPLISYSPVDGLLTMTVTSISDFLVETTIQNSSGLFVCMGFIHPAVLHHSVEIYVDNQWLPIEFYSQLVQGIPRPTIAPSRAHVEVLGLPNFNPNDPEGSLPLAPGHYRVRRGVKVIDSREIHEIVAEFYVE